MESYAEQHRFEKFLIQRGKSPGDFDFLIEFDPPRQSDAYPVTGRVLIQNKKSDRSKIYRFDSSYDWMVEFSEDISRKQI